MNTNGATKKLTTLIGNWKINKEYERNLYMLQWQRIYNEVTNGKNTKINYYQM